jgi:serine/threonine-protein kinase
MDRHRLVEIDEVFAAALELEAGAREQFLAERCSGDPELRREVDLLLAACEAGDLTVETPLHAFIENLGRAEADLEAGELVGAWRVEQPIGRGGMGVVYLVSRADGSFDKHAALKILPHGRTDAEAVRRFEQERQILARLEHPGIARLLDGGLDRRGLPYLVLEHVDGAPVDAYCDREQLPIEARITLVASIARVVHAAHRSLVIHRDLKPSNLLVTDDGSVKLLDFGIAKLLEHDGGGEHTVSFAMTPAFASPEQVKGGSITTASDVYQLGLLLYLLVTGHDAQPSSAVSLSELVHAVCEQEPERPSTVVQRDARGVSAVELASRRRSTPARLAAQLGGELDAIVAHAIEKDPERRYASAEQLAADLERFLEGRPIVARPSGRLERGAKWVRRNPALATASGLAALLMVGYAATVTVQARAIAAERDRAQLETQRATEVERFLVGLFEVSDPASSLGRSIDALELLERGAQRIDGELEDQPAVQARLLATLGQIYRKLGRLNESRSMEERALALRRACFGDRHVEVAESLHHLGTVARHLGDRDAAQAALTEALQLREQLLDPSAPELAETLAEIGYLHYFASELDQAKSYFERALAIREQRGDEREVASTWTSLALIAEGRGKLDEAERLHREALAVNQRLHGELHPELAVNHFNLGRVYQRREDYRGAQPHFERALAIDREVYGARHLEVATDLAQLANNLQILGELDRAEELFEEALSISRELLPAHHLRIATVLHGLGELRLAQGRLDDAMVYLDESLQMRRALFGEPSIPVAQILLPIGLVHVKARKLDQAEHTWREALAMADGEDPLLADRLRADLQRLADLREKSASPGGAPSG